MKTNRQNIADKKICYGERNIFPIDERVAVRLDKISLEEGINFYIKEQFSDIGANELYFKLHKNIVDYVSGNMLMVNFDFAYLGKIEDERLRRFARHGMLTIQAVICYRKNGTIFIDMKDSSQLSKLYESILISPRFCIITAEQKYHYTLFERKQC